jgi:hypothetical protein
MEGESFEVDSKPEPPVPKKPSKFFTAVQLFAIPAAIVGICVGIYLLFTFFSHDPRTPSEVLDALKTSSGHTRDILMYDFQKKVEVNKDNLAKDEMFISKVLSVSRGLRSDGQEDMKLKKLLINTLRVLSSPICTSYVLELLNSKEDEVIKSVCLDTLGAIKDPKTSEDVAKFLNNESVTLRKHAAYNLGAVVSNLGANDPVRQLAVERMKQRLDDKSEEVRWNASFSLARFLGDSAGAPVLRKMLDRSYLGELIKEEDYKSSALKSAILALALIKDKASLEKLQTIARHDPDQEVRHQAHSAIAAINK